MSNRIKKTKKKKKTKNINKNLVDIVARLDCIKEEKIYTIVFETRFESEIVKIVYVNIAIAKNSISTKNN